MVKCSLVVALLFAAPMVCNAATIDFYSDAGGGGANTTVDGWLTSSAGASWQASHDAATAASTQKSATSQNLLSRITPNNTISRFGATFDTSPLKGKLLVSAKFCFYGILLLQDGDSVRMVSFNPAVKNDLATVDYDLSHWGTSGYSGDVQTVNLKTSQYNCLDLNEKGVAAITATGVTALGMRFVSDADNKAPGAFGNNVVQFYAGDSSIFKPYLEVRYAGLPVVGSGTSLGTGALVYEHSACNTYILNGSGAAIGCDTWDTSIEIPYVEFWVKFLSKQWIYFCFVFFSMSILLWNGKSILLWFWKILTQRA